MERGKAMSEHYDTAGIRAYARQIKTVETELRGRTSSKMNQMNQMLFPQFKGMTAEETRIALEEARKRLNRVYADLEALSSAMRAFAARLDDADRQAKGVIQEK